jgi:hypothetical protein
MRDFEFHLKQTYIKTTKKMQKPSDYQSLDKYDQDALNKTDNGF